MTYSSRLRTWRWRIGFVIAMFAMAALSVWANNPTIAALLLLLPVLFGIPMWHEAQLDREQQGEPSPALARHDLRTLIAVLTYFACMIGAVSLSQAIGPGSPWLWAVALLPALPILAIVWAMERYLAEETDEFLRHRAINAALIGIAAVLVLATVWGTLELFGLVPHAGGWLVAPIFAVARDIAKFWLKASDR